MRCSGGTTPTSAATHALPSTATRPISLPSNVIRLLKHGERFVDDVTEVAVDGDRATAKVTYHFDKAPDTKTGVETTFVREDGAWKVCSPGPG